VATLRGTGADGTEVVKFVDGIGVKGRDFIGFRGSAAVLVGREGMNSA
jgi:hypothetical protein